MITYLLTNWLLFALGLIALGIQVWALVECLRTKPAQFERADKRTKGFWTALTVGATLVGVLFELSPGIGFILMLELAAVTASSVYLADVRPAVATNPRGGTRGYGGYGGW